MAVSSQARRVLPGPARRQDVVGRKSRCRPGVIRQGEGLRRERRHQRRSRSVAAIPVAAGGGLAAALAGIALLASACGGGSPASTASPNYQNVLAYAQCPEELAAPVAGRRALEGLNETAGCEVRRCRYRIAFSLRAAGALPSAAMSSSPGAAFAG